MESTKESRKKIWEYLTSIGIELTVEQHNALRELIIGYAKNKNELIQAQLDAMVAANQKRKERNRNWQKNRERRRK